MAWKQMNKFNSFVFRDLSMSIDCSTDFRMLLLLQQTEKKYFQFVNDVTFNFFINLKRISNSCHIKDSLDGFNLKASVSVWNIDYCKTTKIRCSIVKCRKWMSKQTIERNICADRENRFFFLIDCN